MLVPLGPRLDLRFGGGSSESIGSRGEEGKGDLVDLRFLRAPTTFWRGRGSSEVVFVALALVDGQGVR